MILFMYAVILSLLRYSLSDPVCRLMTFETFVADFFAQLCVVRTT